MMIGSPGTTHVAVHVIVPPSLKTGTSIIGVWAVNFDELVKHPPSNSEALVAQMITEDEEHLLRGVRRQISQGSWSWINTYYLYAIPVLVVPWHMSAVSHQNISASYEG